MVENGQVQGYGVARGCRDGAKIGPLFANDPASADLLFRQLVSVAGSGPVALDTPEPNPEAITLARRYGLSPSFETARMYKGNAPDLPTDRTFGVTTFELG